MLHPEVDLSLQCVQYVYNIDSVNKIFFKSKSVDLVISICKDIYLDSSTSIGCYVCTNMAGTNEE